MFKKQLVAILLAGASFSSLANWVGGVSYTSLSEEDIKFGAITGSIAYKIDSDNALSIMPELRYGIGIKDDSIYGFDVELDRFIALSVRGEYEFDSGLYLYAAPSYGNVKLTASMYGESVSDDEWEFGYGAGIGYQFNESIAAELSFEDYDGTDVISVGIKFDF